MTKRAQINIAVLVVLFVLTGAFIFFRYAMTEREADHTPVSLEAPEPTPMFDEPLMKKVGEFSWTPVYVNGKRLGGAYKSDKDGKSYVSFEEFCIMTGVDFDYREGEWSVLEDVPLELLCDGKALGAGGRYFYLPRGLLKLKGHEVYPLKELCSILGFTLTWNGTEGGIHIDTSDPLGIMDGNDGYYVQNDLTWLSHIINAESRDQSLEGKIAVGNVVLNRVESGAYPDTVEAVVFDTNYGVQFTPVVTGTIYNEPSRDAVIAAKICLEGYELVGDSLYFVNAGIANDSWFASARTFVASIGDHDFYA